MGPAAFSCDLTDPFAATAGEPLVTFDRRCLRRSRASESCSRGAPDRAGNRRMRLHVFTHEELVAGVGEEQDDDAMK